MRGTGVLALAENGQVERRANTTGAVDQDIRDLARQVYCLLGMPIDAVNMAATLRATKTAALESEPFFISTANLNFLANSLADPEFRESLLLSDLCTADGMPIVWLARLLGLPIRQRIAGADFLDKLRAQQSSRKLKVFFFGGAGGIADAARRALNAQNGGLTCVGTLNPGFGTIDDMSSNEIIAQINASKADFLVAALGANKGQAWLQHNHHRLRIPVRAHLGAAINFQAGSIKRAPQVLRKAGLEWLWRIKEEPHLWPRYWRDACMLGHLLGSRVLPLAYHACLTRWRRSEELKIGMQRDEDSVSLQVSGDAITPYVDLAVCQFQYALAIATPLVILDFTGVRHIDQRFFGVLLMLRKCLRSRGATLSITGVSDRVHHLFQLNELEFLLDPKRSDPTGGMHQMVQEVPEVGCL